MILSENEAKNLLSKIISLSKADSISVILSGNNSSNLRFALNSISTNGYQDALEIDITSSIGNKTGSVRINKFDNDSIKKAIKLSENYAKLSPENIEFIPPPEKQSYLQAVNYSKSTEDMTNQKRKELVKHAIDESEKNTLTTAGFYMDNTSFTALQNSNGLFAYNLSTLTRFSATFRTEDGTGSSRTEKQYVDIGNLNIKPLVNKAVNRAKLSVNPIELKPGKYTVILEPAAVADMTALCLNFMSARDADETRSYFSRKGGGNLIGEKISNERVNIYSNPVDPLAPSITFTREGMPLDKTVWFENGILKNLTRNRFWAKKTDSEVVPYPSNLIMTGSSKTLEQMISETDYAVLVTRFWYIRTVDPQTMLLTGLTRDGVFEIVDGKIRRPVKNFRFNESPVNIFKNIVDIGLAEKATGSENEFLQIHVPALKVKEFNFSSLSDAI
jgi:predicted Zn-dependent protease